MKRTDLAAEFTADVEEKGFELTDTEYEGVKVTKITLGHQAVSIIGKPAGKYITLNCADKNKYVCARALAHYITELMKPCAQWERVMVAGLGNISVTPDSLGPRAVRLIPATAHLSSVPEFTQLGLRPVYVIETGVMAQTGLESTDRLRYIASNILPAAVIAVDSLACTDFSHLGTTVQLTDTGIAPGSGVGGDRKPLDSAIMGAKVIAVGVPTVIDLDNIAENVNSDMMVTPKNIDSVIKDCAEIISLGINAALNPALSPEDISRLLF